MAAMPHVCSSYASADQRIVYFVKNERCSILKENIKTAMRLQKYVRAESPLSRIELIRIYSLLNSQKYRILI